MAEKYKIVTVQNHEYRIAKFSAMDGAFIIPKVTGLLAPILEPLLNGVDVKKVSKPEDFDLKGVNFAALLAPLANIPEDDFKYIQRKTLGVIQVKMPAGYQPVVYDNGSFSIPDLEEDAMAVLSLMVHALIHNFSSFFAASGLTGLLSTILPSSSQN